MNNNSAQKLYFDLLKDTLSFSFWPEPPVPWDTRIPRGPKHRKSRFVRTLATLLARRGLHVVQYPPVTEEERREGSIWPSYAFTMVGRKRLDNIHYCVETVLADNIPGDLIETGVWRGGSCIFMKAILSAFGVTDRRVFVADSFEGLPPPNETDYPADKGLNFHKFSQLAISLEQVQENFRKFGLLDNQVVFLKGWFKDTLPAAPIDNLALLRLDGDLYESTMDALKNLYPKLSPGGFCIVDDYLIDACAQAVTDYREQQGIKDEIQKIDWTSVFWRKS